MTVVDDPIAPVRSTVWSDSRIVTDSAGSQSRDPITAIYVLTEESHDATQREEPHPNSHSRIEEQHPPNPTFQVEVLYPSRLDVSAAEPAGFLGSGSRGG